MKRPKCLKTYPKDFEKIYPLLTLFNSPYTKEEWRSIFDYDWQGKQDFIGFHLETATEVVGFIGLIFSQRVVEGKMKLFCNISSFIVKETHRASSVLLLQPLRTLKDVIFTGFAPIKASYQLMTMLGFTTLEKQVALIPTLQTLYAAPSRHFYQDNAILSYVSGELYRIVADHLSTRVASILFEEQGRQLLIIYKIHKHKMFKVSVPKVRVIYLSDPSFFEKFAVKILKTFSRLFGLTTILYVDSRFLSSQSKLWNYRKNVDPCRIKYGTIANDCIDELYSENVLL
ncbi:MAG: hypothetical protein H2069_00175 [Legionella sp.]|nr:hypothetical protein [Legionella sp.]